MRHNLGQSARRVCREEEGFSEQMTSASQLNDGGVPVGDVCAATLVATTVADWCRASESRGNERKNEGCALHTSFL
jgi:hypothetical protein